MLRVLIYVVPHVAHLCFLDWGDLGEEGPVLVLLCIL